MNKVKRNYKDNTFCALFSEKENLIELYNALSGSSFDMDTHIFQRNLQQKAGEDSYSGALRVLERH